MNSANWWASKLGAPQPQSSLPPQVIQQPAQQVPAYNIPQPNVPQRAEVCPNCRSGNYGKLTAETRARCYDCGYPIVQQGSGIGTVGSSGGPTQAARQAVGEGFNPGTIVGNL